MDVGKDDSAASSDARPMVPIDETPWDTTEHGRLARVELRGCLWVPLALRQDLSPEAIHLGAVAALSGQHRQVAPGQVPVDSLIDAAKLLGPAQGQDPPPARLGLGGLAPVPVDDRLAELALGILRVDRESLGAGAQCLTRWCARP